MQFYRELEIRLEATNVNRIKVLFSYKLYCNRPNEVLVLVMYVSQATRVAPPECTTYLRVQIGLFLGFII